VDLLGDILAQIWNQTFSKCFLTQLILRFLFSLDVLLGRGQGLVTPLSSKCHLNTQVASVLGYLGGLAEEDPPALATD
jgi:hypothetical protein